MSNDGVLVMPKDEYSLWKIQQYAINKSVTNTSVFLGMSSTANNFWYWDDGSRVIVQCKNATFII